MFDGEKEVILTILQRGVRVECVSHVRVCQLLPSAAQYQIFPAANDQQPS